MNEPQVNWASQKGKILGFTFVLYLDLLSAVLQYGFTSGWNWEAWNPIVFFQALSEFKSTTIDLIVLSLIRVISIPILLFFAIRVGNPLAAVHRYVTAKPRSLLSSSEVSRNSKEAEDSQPLLSDVEEGFHGKRSAAADKADELIAEVTEKEKKAVKKVAEKQKNVYLVLIFILLTGCEVHVGVKSIVYGFDTNSFANYIIAASSMASLVLWMNFELFLSRSLSDALTKDKGELFPLIHPHPLYYDDTVAGHMCDNCRKRHLREAFSCRDCNYDLCLECTKKKTKARSEGLIRGDKGLREEKEFSDWDYMKRGLSFAAPHAFIIVVAIIMMLASSAAQLILPNYQGKIMDNIIKGDYDTFSFDVKLFLGFTVAVGIFGGIRNLCFNLVGQQMSNEIRNRLFKSVIIQDIVFFDGTTTGDLTSRLSQDTSAMVAPTRTLLSTFLSSVLYLIGGLAMCLFTSWRLSVLAFTTIGPIVLVYRVYSSWSRQINKEIWAALGDASDVATQAIGNIRTVRAFGMEPAEEKKYQTATTEALDRGIKDAYAGAGTFALTNYIDLGISVLLLWYGGTVVMSKDGRLSVGNMITFQLYWAMIASAYSNLSDILSQFTRAGGAAQRVLNLMEHLPDIDPTLGAPVPVLKGDIELKQVEFVYQMRPEEKVLKGLDLSIKAGQTLALVGKSGGGKSTIIHLLLRYYNPTSGSIFIDGRNLNEINPIEYRRHVGIVSQDTQLFNSTIEENIAYGCENYTQADLVAAAKQANAHEFIVKFEEGYLTRAGERGVRLSGGQKQRLAIARAFLRKPKLLFLDEATSALDAESEALVQDAIDKLIKTSGCTVILVAHRLSTVINADKIAVIDKGQVVEQGKHDELVALGGVYSKLVHRQVSRMQNTLDLGKDPKKEKIDVVDKLLEDS